MKARIWIYFPLFLLCLGLVLPASIQAAERVAFKREDGRTALYELILNDMRDKEAAHVMEYHRANYKPYIETYETDLNGDGVKEVLAFFTDFIGEVPPPGLPPLVVYARQSNYLKRLGTFNTWQHVQISDQTTNGIRDLFIFENPRNQHQYKIYSYNTDTGIYEKKKKAN